MCFGIDIDDGPSVSCLVCGLMIDDIQESRRSESSCRLIIITSGMDPSIGWRDVNCGDDKLCLPKTTIHQLFSYFFVRFWYPEIQVLIETMMYSPSMYQMALLTSEEKIFHRVTCDAMKFVEYNMVSDPLGICDRFDSLLV